MGATSGQRGNRARCRSANDLWWRLGACRPISSGLVREHGAWHASRSSRVASQLATNSGGLMRRRAYIDDRDTSGAGVFTDPASKHGPACNEPLLSERVGSRETEQLATLCLTAATNPVPFFTILHNRTQNTPLRARPSSCHALCAGCLLAWKSAWPRPVALSSTADDAPAQQTGLGRPMPQCRASLHGG